ncbi:hypothetical protein JCM8547_007160 [Rhodosporidiobolus lusitaniae]
MLPTIAHLSTRPPVLWTLLPSHLPYSAGLFLQESLVQARLPAKAALLAQQDRTHEDRQALQRVAETAVLLLQHSLVYTAGRREKDADLAQEEGDRLKKLGADYVPTMRGGQTTYRGPGQLVGYSLMDLGAAKLSTCATSTTSRLFLPFLASCFSSIPLQPVKNRRRYATDISTADSFKRAPAR